MRATTSRIASGFMLLAALTLAGCSSSPASSPVDSSQESTASQPKATDEPAGDTTSEDTSANTADCAPLTAGQTVDREQFTSCVAGAMSQAKGYAATSDVMGMSSTTRINLTEGQVSAFSTATPMGDVISIDGKTYIRVGGGEWKPGDPNSTDPIEAGLSQAAVTIGTMDPTTLAGQVTGDLTVTGTDNKAGTDVLVLSGTQEANGVSMEATFFVTPEWVVMGSTATGDLSGTPITTTMELTEWDVLQDIAAPM
ncbi:hypothetical protein [Microbacterium gorillae]|uniref:hypothetical protein n=1 Tax=Microbacterium gorillae TaxID=1231063 RepID=UPI003D99D92A